MYNKYPLTRKIKIVSVVLEKFPINMNINLEIWNNYWMKSKEKTVSSYLGLYFGHCKVQINSSSIVYIKN